jgi:hypothetical protein
MELPFLFLPRSMSPKRLASGKPHFTPLGPRALLFGSIPVSEINAPFKVRSAGLA